MFRLLSLLLCPVLAVLIEVYTRPFITQYMAAVGYEAPLNLELSSLLQAVPQRLVSAEEKERFEEDGVAVIRGLLASDRVLELLREASSGPTYAHNCLPVNGPMVSLARDGPVGPVVSQLLGGRSLRVWSGQYFNKKHITHCGERNSFSTCDSPHLDLDANSEELLPFASAWVALSEANHSVGFIAGSHAARHGCGYSDAAPDDACLVALAASLTKLRGRPSIVTYALKPGDAVVFYNQVFHYTKEETETPLRAALSVRYVAADHGFQGPIVETTDIYHWWSFFPKQCTALDSGVLFPPAHAPAEAGKWPPGWPLRPTFWDIYYNGPRNHALETTDSFLRCDGRPWAKSAVA
mmetsp:Transcript_1465/g.4336  ORF Transcript_1465/g.4336 Transcript_1465/m.4336 type:complete len:352 (+) Transcript_1465:75-1130(+)